MLEQIKAEINNMLKNDRYYKAYSKENTIKAILIDINNIFIKYQGPETKFILDIDELKKENQKLKNQQKEFIQWLESEISFIKNTYSQINGDYMTMNPVIKNWIAIMEKILSKYKEIIGSKE